MCLGWCGAVHANMDHSIEQLSGIRKGPRSRQNDHRDHHPVCDNGATLVQR